MRIISTGHGYGHNVYVVALGREDEGRTEMELVTEADNRSNYRDMTVRHFGGTVESLGGELRRVKVYID